MRPPSASPLLDHVRPSGRLSVLGWLSGRWLGRAVAAGLARVDLAVVGLLLLPLPLLVADRNWIYTMTGSLDPWIYFGYYLNFPENIRVFDGTYYATRLTVILPGALVHKWFSPVVAHHVLHLGLFYLSVLCLYGTLRHVVCRRAAFLAAALMGCYYYFRFAIGSDYVDGFGITYFLVAIWALGRANRSARPAGWLLLAGTALAAMVVANSSYLILLPFPLLVYLVQNRATRGHRPWVGAVLAAAGFVGLVLALCVVNYRISGRFLFFLPSFDFAYSHVSKPGDNQWLRSDAPWAWVKNAPWVVLPAVAAVGSVFGLATTRREAAPDGSRWRWAFLVQMVVMMAVFVGLEASRKLGALQFWFYASLLIPAAFLALGVLIDRACRQIGRREFPGLAALALGALIAGWFGAIAFKEVPHGTRAQSLVSAVCGAAAVLLVRIPRPGAALAGLLALFLCLGDVGARAWVWQSDSLVVDDNKGNRRTPMHVLSGLHRRNELLAVSDTHQALRSAGQHTHTWFWFDSGEPLPGVYIDAASGFNYGYRMIGNKFPDLTTGTQNPEGMVELMRTGQITRVAVLSQDPLAHDKAVAAMRGAGIDVRRMVWYQKIERGPIHYQVIIFELAKAK